ncbi:MAG: glycosyltransferase family 2 protein [Alphaproteobacteria bacterium]|nr:glycosyltransferase family 2 protein [Alphaproteobacteria bacterium]
MEQATDAVNAPPGVSFVCPVYNKEQYLAAVCAAMRDQEGGFDREFIFVDDGSSDRSVELLRDLTRDWPDTRIVVQANQGPSGSTNTGCNLARLSHIKLVGSDDLLVPFATDLLLRRIEETGVGAIYSIQRYYGDPSEIAYDRASAYAEKPRVVADHLYQAMRHNFSGTTGTLFRRDAFIAAGGCDRRVFAEDFSLCLRICRQRPIAMLEAVTCWGPGEDPNRIMTGRKNQLLHDYNAALHYFLADNAALPARYGRLAFRRCAGRAWKWASREEGRGWFSRFWWLNAWSYAPLFCDFAWATGETLSAFALSRPIRPGYGAASSGSSIARVR